MTLYAFLIISVYEILKFMHFLQKRDIPTDGPTDQRTNGPTDQRTDTPSYRDAKTHLKMGRRVVAETKLRMVGPLTALGVAA